MFGRGSTSHMVTVDYYLFIAGNIVNVISLTLGKIFFLQNIHSKCYMYSRVYSSIMNFKESL